MLLLLQKIYFFLLGGTGGPISRFPGPVFFGDSISPSVYDCMIMSLSLWRIVRYLLGKGASRHCTNSSSSRPRELQISLFDGVNSLISLSSSVGGASLVGNVTAKCKTITNNNLLL